jgi:hypothetical protein
MKITKTAIIVALVALSIAALSPVGAVADQWTSSTTQGRVVEAYTYHSDSTLINGSITVLYPGIGKIRHNCNFIGAGVVSDADCHNLDLVRLHCPNYTEQTAVSDGEGAVLTFTQVACGANEAGACVRTGGYYIESTFTAREGKVYATSVTQRDLIDCTGHAVALP